MEFRPRAQEIYKHFKGNLYQVLAIAEHSETGEELVIYQAMYGDFKIYARELSMFISEVDREKYPDAAQKYRFELQGEQRDRDSSETEPAAEKKPAKDGIRIADLLNAAGRNYAVWRPDGKGTQDREAQETVQTETAQQGSDQLDPLVLEFLDAESYTQKINILTALHPRITNEMITTLAICSNVEIEGEDVEQRYHELRQCLQTKDRYEIKRPY